MAASCRRERERKKRSGAWEFGRKPQSISSPDYLLVSTSAAWRHAKLLTSNSSRKEDGDNTRLKLVQSLASLGGTETPASNPREPLPVSVGNSWTNGLMALGSFSIS